MMSMREKMARAGYDAASRELIADLCRRNPFGNDREMSRWDNQSGELHETWLAVADAMLDVLEQPTEDMEAELRDKQFKNGRELYQGAIRAAKDGK